MRLGPRTGIYAEDAGKKKQEKNREMMINFVRNLHLFASPALGLVRVPSGSARVGELEQKRLVGLRELRNWPRTNAQRGGSFAGITGQAKDGKAGEKMENLN